jgi:hypothetical protein
VNSTPVGPPPITTNVSQRRRSASSVVCAACSKHARTWLRTRCARGSVFILSVWASSAELPK